MINDQTLQTTKSSWSRLTEDSMQDLCKHGGWQLGHRVDGCHAEYFRMPYADTGLYHVPPGVDERGLLVVSDTLPTGLEVGTIRGNVQPGCTVEIVGAGVSLVHCKLQVASDSLLHVLWALLPA